MSNKINEYYLLMFERHLKLKGMTKNTIKTYLQIIDKFLKKVSNNAKDVPQNVIEDYILSMINSNYMSNTIKLTQIVLKIFFNEMLKRDFKIQNYKNKKRLPQILSKEEIEEMIKVTINLKHKLIIMLFYSAGLRLDELRNLKKIDIDFERDLIRVEKGKGNKTRYTILSKYAKELLIDYIKTTNSKYLFQGRNSKLNKRTIQQLVKNAGKKAKIKKEVHPRMLRHCFATHLMDNGIDINHIQRLLGHSNISTTQIYTVMSKKHLDIKSPLD